MLGKFKTNRLSTILLLGALLAMISSSSRAQDTTQVTGIVYNHMKQPVKDVSVSIAGSLELPVVTDETGVFTVKSESGEDWLIISPADDYKPKRIYLNNRHQLEVYLTPFDISSGEDEIIILSRTIKKRNMASAYSSVSLRDLTGAHPVTIDEFIQGRAAGVNVVKRSGHPGSGAYITIRGINTLNAGNQPLYLIDGIPVASAGVFGSNIDGYSFNPLVQLNPMDVSQLNVIKDPAITAAYGSKASNGLILIETLDPSVTKTVIELDIRGGLSLTQSNPIPQLNANQHKTLVHEVLYTSGKFEEDLIFEYPNLFLEPDDKRFIDYQHNTNWQNEIFANASFSDVNINVKGGDEIATYGLSFGMFNNTGTIKKTSYQGYNLRFVSRLNVFRWMKMNAGVSMNYNKGRMKEAATSEETNPILAALGKSPLLNPYQYDEQGREISAVSEVDELGVSNPAAVINGFEAKNTNSSFVFAMGMHADVNSRIALVSKNSFTYNTLKELIFMPNHGMEHYYNDEAHNVSKDGSNNLQTFYSNTYLNFKRDLGGNHNISSMTGFNLETNNFEFDWGIAKNAHVNDQYQSLKPGQDDLNEIGGINRVWNWLSLYENLVYTYKDNFMVTASLSFDGSSRVGDEAANTVKVGGIPFGLFYSAGFAWRLSNETVLKNLSWLEDLRWRLSYGKTGNDDIGESSASNYYKSIRYRETVGLYPAVITNKKLTYESVTQLNTGIDIALWGNRFSGTVDIFRSQTKNMLIFSPVDAFLGYDYRMENSGKMKNTGLEFTANGRIIERGTVRWDIQITLSKIRNEVIDIKGSKLVTSLAGAEIVNMEGSPANSFYGFIYKGVFATTEEAATANLINDKDMPFGAGDAIYADLSGPEGIPDHIINDYDKTSIGSSLPDLSGGIGNAVTYKKFTLRTMVYFVLGNDVFNYVRFKNEQMSGLQNQSANVLNRWQYQGQVTDVPRALLNDTQGNADFSTRWIEDGSYIRLSNVSLSYRIPNEFLTFKNAEFYFSANNLLTLTRYLGYDPEFSYSYVQMHQGIDYGHTPQSRQFILGIKVGL